MSSVAPRFLNSITDQRRYIEVETGYTGRAQPLLFIRPDVKPSSGAVGVTVP